MVQIKKKWSSPGVIKLFNVFIWLRAACPFLLLSPPCLSQRMLLLVLLISQHTGLLPVLGPPRPTCLRTPQTICLSPHCHCRYLGPPSSQLPRALGIFYFLSMTSLSLCATGSVSFKIARLMSSYSRAVSFYLCSSGNCMQRIGSYQVLAVPYWEKGGHAEQEM